MGNRGEETLISCGSMPTCLSPPVEKDDLERPTADSNHPISDISLLFSPALYGHKTAHLPKTSPIAVLVLY